METVPLLNAGEEAIEIGTVIRGYPKIRVAAVNPIAGFGTGTTLIFQPIIQRRKQRPCRITARSLQINHRPVDVVQPGEACGIGLDCPNKELPRRGDKVWLVLSPQQIAKAVTERNVALKTPLIFTKDNDGAC